MTQPSPNPTFKRFLVDLMLADGERSGLPNYRLFFIFGVGTLLLALCTAPEGLHGLSLWRHGMPLDTPASTGKHGQVTHLSDEIGLFLVPLLLSLFCLALGFFARKARLKRDRETLYFDPVDD